MSNPGSPMPMLQDFGGGEAAGNQAQFGILLQLIQRIVAALEGVVPNNDVWTVYPVTAAGNINLAADYPTVRAGTFSIRKTVPAATTVTLRSEYGPWIVADGAGNASSYPITVDAPGGYTINGAASYILAFDWQSAIFILDGTNFIIA